MNNEELTSIDKVNAQKYYQACDDMKSGYPFRILNARYVFEDLADYADSKEFVASCNQYLTKAKKRHLFYRVFAFVLMSFVLLSLALSPFIMSMFEVNRPDAVYLNVTNGSTNKADNSLLGAWMLWNGITFVSTCLMFFFQIKAGNLDYYFSDYEKIIGVRRQVTDEDISRNRHSSNSANVEIFLSGTILVLNICLLVYDIVLFCDKTRSFQGNYQDLIDISLSTLVVFFVVSAGIYTFLKARIRRMMLSEQYYNLCKSKGEEYLKQVAGSLIKYLIQAPFVFFPLIVFSGLLVVLTYKEIVENRFNVVAYMPSFSILAILALFFYTILFNLKNNYEDLYLNSHP